MKAMKVLTGMLSVCVTMPIWYYLLYRILMSVNATEVMWLLYWVYLPVGLFVSILVKVTEAKS